MSLSKNIRNSSSKEESWHKYEMESFEPYALQQQKRENDFVSLDPGEGKRESGSDPVPATRC